MPTAHTTPLDINGVMHACIRDEGDRLGRLSRGAGADASRARGERSLSLGRQAASAADAVIHTAYSHDFSKPAESAAQDARAIEVLGRALEGSDRPLLMTSGVAMLAPGCIATEHDVPAFDPSWPRKSELVARALAERGIRVSTVRLAPSVQGVGDLRFVPILIGLAREKGVSATWPAGRTAGQPCTGSMRGSSTGWHSSMAPPSRPRDSGFAETVIPKE